MRKHGTAKEIRKCSKTCKTVPGCPLNGIQGVIEWTLLELSDFIEVSSSLVFELSFSSVNYGKVRVNTNGFCSRKANEFCLIDI